MFDLLWILPLVPAVVGLAMLGVKDRRLLNMLDVASTFTITVLTCVIAGKVMSGGVLKSANIFCADAVTVVFLALISLLSLTAAVYTIGWMRREVATGGIVSRHLPGYFALTQAFISTMLVTVLSDNLGLLWISMEATTITSALLVGFRRDNNGLEAAWKYIIVTTIGISLGLFGTVLVYAATAHAQGAISGGTMNFTDIAVIASKLDPNIVRIGFIFIIVGYGTKAGLAPMHMWLPDAHSQAPTPVSALLSGALIKCALFGIIRFHTIAIGACGPGFSDLLLLLFGLISIVIATPFILTQQNFKRLLGYHSVEHVGIIAFGLGIGGSVGTYAALLHVINHGVTKALVFFVAGDAIGCYKTHNMDKIQGFIRVAPYAGTFLMLGAFSLAGTPPFSIFVSELLVIKAAIASKYFIAVAIFLVMVIAIFAGLIHHAGKMAFGEPDKTVPVGGEPVSCVSAMSVLAGVMILMGLTVPSALNNVLTKAVEVTLGH
ncbi:MAG TPA: proton-conducting transporter membrane subunit [Candidatus Omnitrophota bacterium]|nr:proton-conducting transporter membrane subunit [Candidatus Omnitrophota bacterium]